MAIIRNTASMMLKGKVGATTYYVADSRQLARQAMNNSNYGENASRTDLQQARRVKWSNLVNFYSANKAWMPKAYEDLKPGVSIFNRFMQLNINSAEVALTKSEAQAKLWVAEPYRVTQGSLTPLNVTFIESTAGFAVNGDLNALTNAESTIGAFSQAFITANPQFRNGDAIVMVAFSGVKNAPGSASGMDPATYIYQELVLNTESTATFGELRLTWSFNEGRITNDMADNMQAVVFIHTRKSGGKLYVSTQDMVMNDSEDYGYQEWTSAAQLSKAIASYGESTSVPLAPGGQGSLGSGNDSSTGGGGDDDGSGSLG